MTNDKDRSAMSSRASSSYNLKPPKLSHATRIQAIQYPDSQNPLPRRFYRVQHDHSFSTYHTLTGFSSAGYYKMDPRHWLNARRISGHLDARARPAEYTPFISVCDNRGKWAVSYVALSLGVQTSVKKALCPTVLISFLFTRVGRHPSKATRKGVEQRCLCRRDQRHELTP